MATVSVRYFVRDIDAAIDFYCQLLDFHVAMHPKRLVRDALAGGSQAGAQRPRRGAGWWPGHA